MKNSSHGPTDHQCLAAALRSLRAHLALRPATRQEAADLGAGRRGYEIAAGLSVVLSDAERASWGAIQDDPGAAYCETAVALATRAACYQARISARRAAATQAVRS